MTTCKVTINDKEYTNPKSMSKNQQKRKNEMVNPKKSGILTNNTTDQRGNHLQLNQTLENHGPLTSIPEASIPVVVISDSTEDLNENIVNHDSVSIGSLSATDHSTTDCYIDIPDEELARLNVLFEKTVNSKLSDSYDLLPISHLTVPQNTVYTDSTPSVVFLSEQHRKVETVASKRNQNRLVDKTGECRISYSNVSHKHTNFLLDFFTTLLELKWRYHLMLCALLFSISWIIFGLIWWAIVAIDGKCNVPNENGNDNGTYVPCVDGVNDFTSALLFSIESQHTIGYGTRAITTSCPGAIVVLMIQSIFGVIIECVVTGIIFAKIARPQRAHTIMFSKNAVICQRDGVRYLMFRVGDMRKSQTIGTCIKLMLVQRWVTDEGEELPTVTKDLHITTETGGDFFFLAWPITIIHKIDESSPLWELSSDELRLQDWELIVIMEGVVEVTGVDFQVRSSYMPNEILWGHQLKSLVKKQTSGRHKIDYTAFHETMQMTIPTISARRASVYPKALMSKLCRKYSHVVR